METKELYREDELPKEANLAASVSKIFRYTDTEGVVEKVFVDHTAKPRRAYPTGEYYELMEAEDEGKDLETVVVADPKDFTPTRYKRISDIPDDCIISPTPIPGPSGG
jgi:hypothetical protein